MFSQLLSELKERLSSRPAASYVPHYSDILRKISTATAELEDGRSITLMSPDEFRIMFQGFIVPVQETKYKNRTLRRMMDRFHRNIILALAGSGDTTTDGVQLWQDLEAQYHLIMRHLETQWRALGLMTGPVARRQADLSVQLSIGSKHSATNESTICTIETKHGEVSFEVGSAADPLVLSTFLGNSPHRERIRETLECLLQSIQTLHSHEDVGGSPHTGSEYYSLGEESVDPMVHESFAVPQSVRSQSI